MPTSLASRLDTLYSDYNREESATDPVHLVRPFADPADREIAGFCAAALAFGRVGSVINSIKTLLASWPRARRLVSGIRRTRCRTKTR
jgi:hypothetical protein